jgi:hypothetical protein
MSIWIDGRMRCWILELMVMIRTMNELSDLQID